MKVIFYKDENNTLWLSYAENIKIKQRKVSKKSKIPARKAFTRIETER